MTLKLHSPAHTIRAALIGAAIAVAGPAQATLMDRGGGLIYDSVLNVTWLKDTNFAGTSGFASSGPNGAMIWTEAMSWADNLTYFDSVRNVSYSDWHLPTVRPVDGVSWNFSTSSGGNTDDGYNISAPGSPYAGSTASHLAYTYYNTLGNESRCPVGGGWAGCKDPGAPRVPPLATGPFLNLQGHYWTNSNQALPFADALAFEFSGAQYGVQNAYNAGVPRRAWAVRDGDVSAIPEPGTSAMFGTALAIGFAGWLRRKRQVG